MIGRRKPLHAQTLKPGAADPICGGLGRSFSDAAKHLCNQGTNLGQALGGYSGPAKGEEVVFRAGGPVINLGTAGAHNQADYRWVAEQFDKSSDSNYDAAKSRLSHFYGTVVVDDNTDAR